MFNVMAIKSDDVESIWPSVRHYYEKIIADNPEYATMQFIYDKLIDGSYTLLSISHNDSLVMSMVCEVVICPTGQRILMIPHLSGIDMRQWIDELVKTLYLLAEDLQCEEVMISGGRMGWVKEMKRHGGELSHVTVTFDVKKNIGNYHG